MEIDWVGPQMPLGVAVAGGLVGWWEVGGLSKGGRGLRNSQLAVEKFSRKIKKLEEKMPVKWWNLFT